MSDDDDLGWTTDKFGNSITKAQAKQHAAEEKLRQAAKARREAKMMAKAMSAAAAEAPAASAGGDSDRPAWLLDYDKVKAKAAAGGKLSGKDKKLLKRGQEREAEEAETGIGALKVSADADEEPLDARLEGFSLTLPSDAVDDSGRDVVIKGISISAPEKPLIVNADLTLVQGRRYGLIGANGRGKSTLLRFLAARRIPVPAAIDMLLVEQEVAASDRSVLEDVLRADGKRKALLEEEEALFAALEADNVSDDVATATAVRLTAVADELEAIGADGAEARARVILVGLGFTDAMILGPSSRLSGGWRMRVSLARALHAAPRLLLLDEPTNHLDLDAVLWLDTYLNTKFPKTSTVLTVSHDRDFLDETCTDLILLTDDGGLEYHRGGLERLDEGAASRASKRAKDFALQQKMIKEERTKHPALKMDKLTARLLAKLDIPRLAEKPREYSVQFVLRAPEDSRTGAGLSVDLRDVDFKYAGEASGHEGAFAGFKKLNLSVDSNTRAAIVGANGSGKSTLLKLLTGDLEPQKGEVNVGSRLVIGYYDQHFSELKNAAGGSMSAVDFLVSNYGEEIANAQDARKWLGKFGLDSARHVMPIRDLSGGQKARVCFASIALRKPHLLILDEPTNHLDLESVDALVKGLEEYEGGVLAVSHDACLVNALSRNVEGRYADGMSVPLFVCKNSGVALERGGFDKYKRELAEKAEERERREAEEGVTRAEKRSRERRERLARAAREANRDGAAMPPPAPARSNKKNWN
jgi:ATP-binding cassette subfamily F protein 1